MTVLPIWGTVSATVHARAVPNRFAVPPGRVAIASHGGDEHVHDCRGAHEAPAIDVTLCLIRTELGRTTSVAPRYTAVHSLILLPLPGVNPISVLMASNAAPAPVSGLARRPSQLPSQLHSELHSQLYSQRYSQLYSQLYS